MSNNIMSCDIICFYSGGSSSAGRAFASQAKGRGFEPRLPLFDGAMAERLGSGLQNRLRRFDSGSRLLKLTTIY